MYGAVKKQDVRIAGTERLDKHKPDGHGSNGVMKLCAVLE